MNEQLKIQELLRQKFLEFKQTNPSFSVRSFAKILNMQPSATNEIMKGQRKVSIKIAKRIADNLLLDPQETAELLSDFKKKSNLSSANRMNEELLQRNADNFEFISNWIYEAILISLKVHKEANLTQLKNLFEISEAALVKIINRLEKMELIEIDNKNNLRLNNSALDQAIYLNPNAVKNMHLKDLVLIKEKIQIRSNENIITENLTFILDESRLSRAREIIQKSHEELKNLQTGYEEGQIFRVSSFMYPLSKPIISCN